jgi:hypothetical protein
MLTEGEIKENNVLVEVSYALEMEEVDKKIEFLWCSFGGSKKKKRYSKVST